MKKRIRLTSKQNFLLAELLAEKDDAGGYAWVECFKQEFRTAQALQKKGLIEIDKDVKAEQEYFAARAI